ncbi:hypothetical protein Aca07nite_07870 [Actinoplanes capillaceus]|uniref:Flavin reductase n=1 Tax=Actinoplanes campanulatus TaxID=113559 RepID=A0ABQ3W8Y0_9ACTN|nr:hypothetical protein [Actinoplanes capillaceus]GID43512.1 hypothetical protein Aca07nite_07870 [Actinoplanes capillaceus]
MTAEQVLVASSSADPGPGCEHTADRSSWDCRVCERPWPCAPAKVALIEEHRADSSVLLLYLVATFYEARNSYLHQQEPADLYGRFVIWAVRLVNR